MDVVKQPVLQPCSWMGPPRYRSVKLPYKWFNYGLWYEQSYRFFTTFEAAEGVPTSPTPCALHAAATLAFASQEGFLQEAQRWINKESSSENDMR